MSSRHGTPIDLPTNRQPSKFCGLVAVTEIQERHTDSDRLVVACEMEVGEGMPVRHVLLVADMTHPSARTICCAQPGDVLSVDGLAESNFKMPWCLNPPHVIHNPTRVVGWRRFAF